MPRRRLASQRLNRRFDAARYLDQIVPAAFARALELGGRASPTAYDRALALVHDDAERRLIERRVSELDVDGEGRGSGRFTRVRS